MLADAKSMRSDLSGSVCDAEIARRTIAAVGVESVLFATDMSFSESVAKTLHAKLSRSEAQLILHDNFQRIEERRK